MVPGIVIGTIRYYGKEKMQIARNTITDTEAEIARYDTARQQAGLQIQELCEKAYREFGEPQAQIFEAYAMVLEDEEFIQKVYQCIREQKVNVEYAVKIAGDYYADRLTNMEDAYWKERATDVEDISQQLLMLLQREVVVQEVEKEPVIIAAEDLTPSEIMRLNEKNLLALVTNYASVNSHTAILARTMGIPAVTGVAIQNSWHGQTAIIDGNRGEIILAPECEVIEKYQVEQNRQKQQEELLSGLKGRKSATLSGQQIKLCANISSISDLDAVLKNDAEGIGLFRSEYIYLERDKFPTEEEQFDIYRRVLEGMGDKQVVIRTLDIGADKQADYFGLEREANPAMGYRAIRVCLTQKEIFKTQLRALLRASTFGNLAILYPMITSLEEVRRIQEIIEEVKQELKAEHITYGQAPQGIMIETPSAAIISDILAEEVDFFSIGTNDLTQYTLALDRQNPKLDRFYQPHAKAILRQIEWVVQNAHQAGIPVKICGDLAADLTLTSWFLQIGVDELSVPPANILPLRQIVRNIR